MAAIALAVLVAVALLLVFTVDLGRFKGPIEALVTYDLGREVRVDGPLSIRVGRTMKVSAENVVVASAEWDDAQPLVTAGRVRATILTSSVLWGALRILDIELEEPQLRLVTNDAGAGNWEFDPDGDDDELPVLERASIQNGTIGIETPDQAVELTVDSVEHALREERLATSISGSVNDVPLAFAGDIGPREHLRHGGDVTFDYRGDLGEVEFEAEGALDDVLDPRTPSVRLALRGPSVEYLFDVLKVRRITTGTLDISLDLARADGRVDLVLDGQIGEFSIAADGYASDLRTLDEARISVTAAGPDIDHVGRLFDFDRLPQSEFSIRGRFGKSGTELTLDDIELEVGESIFELGGRMRGFPRSDSADVLLTVRGSDIAQFRELLGLPGVLSGPFDLTAKLEAPVDSGERIELDGRIDDISLDVDLFPSLESDFVGTRATFEVDVPAFTTIGTAADVQGLPALPFTLSGSAVYRGDRVGLDRLSATLAGARADTSGIVDLAFPGRLTNLDVRFVTADLAALLGAFGIDGAPAVEVDYRSSLSIRNDNLFVSGIRSRIGQGLLSGSATIALDPLASLVDFGLEARDVSLQAVIPASDAFSPADLPLAAKIDGRYSGGQLTLRRSDIRIGDATLEMNGVVDLPPNTTATSFTVFAEVPNVADLGSSDSFVLPEAPLTVTGRVGGERDAISARDLRMALGDNIIEADLSYARRDPPAIEVRLTAPVLDFRSFIAPPGEAVESPPPVQKRDRVIPDVAFPVDALETADIDVEVDIGTLITHRAAYRDVLLDATVEDGALTVDQASVLGRRGRTYGNMAYVPDAEGWLLSAELKGDGLVIASLELPDETLRSRPAFDLDAALTGRGDNLRDLLATLDGRVLMHSGGGVIPKGSGRLLNLFFGDFGLELLDAVNPLAKSADKLSVECAVLMLDIDDGVVSGNPALIMQLQALRIFAKAKIDLETEVLDMDFNTQQRRGIGISVSDLINPYTKVGGTLASPTIRLDETGAIVEGGAAFATGGLSVIAKALHNRFLSDPDPCGTALESYRKAVEADTN